MHMRIAPIPPKTEVDMREAWDAYDDTVDPAENVAELCANLANVGYRLVSVEHDADDLDDDDL